MKFGFEQRWEASVDDVLAVYIDEAFWSSMAGLSKTNPPEVLGVERHAGRVVVRLRFRLSVDLPSQASRFIDPDDVAWVEEHDWDLDRTPGRGAVPPRTGVGPASGPRPGRRSPSDGVDTVRPGAGRGQGPHPARRRSGRARHRGRDRRPPHRGGRRGARPASAEPPHPAPTVPAPDTGSVADFVDEVGEAVEEVAAVVGTGTGLGVVLDAEGRRRRGIGSPRGSRRSGSGG